MALDGDLNLRILAEEVRSLSKGVAGIGTNVGFVEVEVGVLHFLEEEGVIVDSRSCGGGGGGGWATVTRTLESAEPPGPLAVIV